MLGIFVDSLADLVGISFFPCCGIEMLNQRGRGF